MNDNVSGSIVNNKGLLKYSIDFGTNKNNFTINTILRNLGITDKDGNAVWADSLKYNDSGVEKDRDKNNALQIKGGENFFRETGGNNITRFSLKADSEKKEKVKEVLKKMKPETDEEDINWGVFYDINNKYYNLLKNCIGDFDDDYGVEYVKGNDKFENSDIDSMKTTINQLLQLAKLLPDVIDDRDKEGKYCYDTAQLLYNMVDTGIWKDIDNGKKALVLMSIYHYLIKYEMIVIVSEALCVPIRDTQYYKDVNDLYNSRKEQQNTIVGGNKAYEDIKNDATDALITLPEDCIYTKGDIAILVALDRWLSNKQDTDLFLDGIFCYRDTIEDTKFRELCCLLSYKSIVSRHFGLKDNCFKDLDSNTEYTDQFQEKLYNQLSSLSASGMVPGGNKVNAIFSDEILNLISDNIIGVCGTNQHDLTLHTTPTTTDENASQTENTYQIFETTNQKLYWGGTKLTIEIPIDLPEQTADNSKITAIQIYQDYKNEEFLATQTASE